VILIRVETGRKTGFTSTGLDAFVVEDYLIEK